MLPDTDCRAYFNGLAAGWDAQCVSRPELLRAVAFLSGASSGKRILDIACGTGVMFPALLETGAELVGVDISDGMAAVARSKFTAESRAQVLCADVLALDAEPFDAALIYNAYPHFLDKEALLAKVSALLLPGGRFTLAHGMGRAALNAHHGNVPSSVSSPLGPAREEANRWEPWFAVDMLCDTPEFYLVSGVKKPA